jgi:hypothetical protein
MLEIVLVIWLSSRLAEHARNKGLSGWWGVLFAAGWFGGQFAGAFIGALFVNNIFAVYAFGFLGGILGGIAAWLLVGNLPTARYTAEQQAYEAIAADSVASLETGAGYGAPATQGYGAASYAAAAAGGATPLGNEPAQPARRAGYCMDCGKNVWLTATGGCPDGHGPQSITNCYAA